MLDYSFEVSLVNSSTIYFIIESQGWKNAFNEAKEELNSTRENTKSKTGTQPQSKKSKNSGKNTPL